LDENSFCSVAGLPMRAQRTREQTECRLGDALTMIAPVTGNGMSMAFEAAAIALDPITAYADGETSWDGARSAIARTCAAAFRQRLFWARWLQAIMFGSAFQGTLGATLLNCNWLWRQLFARTR
jgi:flavin-dependent dehydrogenase